MRVNAQGTYYYYNGDTIPITINHQYVYVMVDTTTFNSFSSSITAHTAEFSLQRLDDMGTSKWGKLNLGTSLNQTEYDAKLLLVKNTTGVQYTSSYFQDGNRALGTSNYFQVKLKDVSDLPLLQNHATTENFTILKQNEFMPKWYELSCNSNSTLTTLEMCNLLYETNLYDAVDPGFMFNFKPSCTNDPYFGLQWHLNNTTNPGIDINACNAWTLSTGAGVNVAVIDRGINLTHPDLINNIHPLSYNTLTGNSPSLHAPHGTFVAGIVGAEKDNNYHLAGVAPDSKLMSISHPLTTAYLNTSVELADGINWAVTNGADIINNSWGDQGGSQYNLFHSSLLESAITNAIVNGRNGLGAVVVFASGNFGATMDYPGNFTDEIATVGGINSVGNRWVGSGFGPKLDVVAPCDLLISTQQSAGLGYLGSGTSFAAPQYAGVAALMLSANPMLTGGQVRDIIESTSQKILNNAPYIYSYHSDRPNGNWNNEMGYGLIDAEQAVLLAQTTNSAGIDLYIKDRSEDTGAPSNYSLSADRDKSPDIWVRNQPDGATNQVNEDAEYTDGQPVYVYVRVRNRSVIDLSASHLANLKIYWSKAATWISWPNDWDGTNPLIGDLIGSWPLSNLYAGQNTILEFQWNILNPAIHNNWGHCLLARIEDAPNDPIVPEQYLNDDVYFNNNIALRNILVVDLVPGKPGPIVAETQYPNGKYMLIGNPTGTDETYNIKFAVPETVEGESINEVAEIKIIFDDEGWGLITNYITPNNDIEIDVENKTIISRSESFQITDVPFNSNTRVPIYVGFSFLSDEVGIKQEFKYHVKQYLAEDNSLLGGNHFIVKIHDRNDFDADAGNDKDIKVNESATVHANDISEPATYNWYDEAGTLIYTGKDLYVSPQITEKYKLEVIADADGFKDYDEVTVEVKHLYIETISPNPASAQVVVNYKADDASSAYIMVLNSTATINNNYIINVNQTQTSFNVANLQQGMYSVILICDGIAVDMKSLIVQ